jgi:uncharacterized membrane protein YfcA
MIEAGLDAGLGWTVAGGLVAASFGTSFITAAFGIGGGGVLLAILASLVPPAALIPVHGLVQLGSNTGRAVVMFRHRDQGVLLPFAAGALAGVVLGGSVVVQLPPDILRIGVGLFILWSVLATPPAFMRRSAVITGGFSSFLTMFFGGTGPFVAAYVKTMGFTRMTHVATHALLMTVQHLLGVPGHPCGQAGAGADRRETLQVRPERDSDRPGAAADLGGGPGSRLWLGGPSD